MMFATLLKSEFDGDATWNCRVRGFDINVRVEMDPEASGDKSTALWDNELNRIRQEAEAEAFRLFRGAMRYRHGIKVGRR